MRYNFNTVIIPEDDEGVPYAREIHAQGLPQTGCSGLYSRAFTNNSTPYVVKIGRGTDTGYMAYLSTIMELNIQNRFLPKIYEVIYYKHEKNVGVSEDSYAPYLDAFVVKMEKLKDGRISLDRDPNKRSMFERTVGMIAEAVDRYPLKNTKISKELEEAITVLHIAKELAMKDSSDACFDLHSGNFLLRKGRIVITDPLC